MDRRKFVSNAAIGGSAILLYSHLLTSCNSKSIKRIPIPTDAPFRMDYLSDNVGYFTERGGTIAWMTGKKGLVIVDTQFPDQAANLIDQIRTVSKRKFDAIINTHHHGDHTSGNIAFKDLTETIISHENSRKNQENRAIASDKMADILLPNTTFKNNYSIQAGDETINMHYFGAAHTDGDIIVQFENANVVHMGDLIFNRRFPYIDTGAGANIANWIVVLDKTLEKYDDESKFIFGHSDNGYDVIGNKEDIKAFKNYLERLLDFGILCKKEGKSLEEALQTSTIKGAEEWKGKGIDRSIKAVYSELNI